MVTDPEEFRQRLLDIQNSVNVEYTRLPLNEPHFIINANTRTITIPSEFGFIGVKNDHKAENIYFEIDRYFDYEDLSNHTCIVQYSYKGFEGIYPVTSLDVESIDGKILFCWTIMNDATRDFGDINFSVRFYSIENDEYTYNFNTLTASSKILDTLDVNHYPYASPTPEQFQIYIDKTNEISDKMDNFTTTVTESENKAKEYANDSMRYRDETRDISVEEIEKIQQAAETKEQEVIANIETKEQEVLVSIPEDYTNLNNEIAELKGDLAYVEKKCGYEKTYTQKGTSDHVVNFEKGKTYTIDYNGGVITTFKLFKTDTYVSTEPTNIELFNSSPSGHVVITMTEDFPNLHVYEENNTSISFTVATDGVYDDKFNEISDHLTNYVEKSVGKNKYNPNSNTIVKGKYVNYASGLVESVATMEYETFPVKAGDVYSVSGYSTQMQVAFFNGAVSKANYVSGVVNSTPFTVPTNATTMTVSIKTSDAHTFQLENGNTVTPYAPYEEGLGTDDINNGAISFKKLGYDVQKLIGKKIVTVGTGMDYSNIVLAIKENQNDTIFKVSGEIFNIEAQYKDVYGDTFFDDYVHYQGYPDMYRGLNLGDGCEIIGTSKTVFDFPYNGNNENVHNRFSIVATTQNNRVENLCFKLHGNCRYAIHDDYATKSGTNIFKNCTFEGATSDNGRAYIGAGMGVENTYIITGCVFLDENTRSISYHNSVSSGKNKLFIENCYCANVIYIFHYGSSTEKTPVTITGTKVKNILLGYADQTTYPNENMIIYEWNNTITN